MSARPSGILAIRDAPVHEVFGLACGLSLVPAMERAHRHDDVELLLPVGGAVGVEHAAHRFDLADGEGAILWAGLPHRVADHDQGAAVAWLTVPLADVLAWPLPAGFVADLLRGSLSTFDAPPALASSMGQWQRDVGTTTARTEAVRLEAQAWLLRASSEVTESRARRPRDAATRMASVVATRFREPLSVAEVAAAVHLHPSTAAARFRESMGVTIGEYLAQCRVAEAQRLLLSTDLPTADVALRSGFGSTSRFYERFVRDCGMAPAAYRRAMR